MLKVKLVIWFPIIKSWESPIFPCMQVACNIPLKCSRQGVQFCFRPHLNWRSGRKVMGPQSCGNPNYGNFGIPTWESLYQNDIWVLVLWLDTKYTIRGKVVASPSLGYGESCEFVFACGSFVHQSVVSMH